MAAAECVDEILADVERTRISVVATVDTGIAGTRRADVRADASAVLAGVRLGTRKPVTAGRSCQREEIADAREERRHAPKTFVGSAHIDVIAIAPSEAKLCECLPGDRRGDDPERRHE